MSTSPHDDDCEEGTSASTIKGRCVAQTHSLDELVEKNLTSADMPRVEAEMSDTLEDSTMPDDIDPLGPRKPRYIKIRLRLVDDTH